MKKITLKELPFETQFYWQGVRYKQLLRPKTQRGNFSVYCYPSNDIQARSIEISSTEVVKPVVKVFA